MIVTWYNFGAMLLLIGIVAGAMGLDDVAWFLVMAAVACAMLDAAIG